jgi:hypothetical protein
MTDFIRIPPDSTGKRIRHGEKIDIHVTSLLINLNEINLGETLTDDVSGNTATFTGWYITPTGVTEIVALSPNGNFTPSGTLSYSGGTIGTITSTTEMYTPYIHISDPLSPGNAQRVDKNGRAYVRYSEGDLKFDAFGNAQFSGIHLLDSYDFVYFDYGSEKFSTITSTGGSALRNSTDSSLTFTTTTTSGSYVSRTTHQYYPYSPGIGTQIEMSMLIGDAGKEGVVRRWGMFDQYNGVFFQLSGSNFQVVLRNNSSGTVVDTIVNQSEFNGDSLDSLTTSEYLLSLDKYNLYWLDYQWLGVGRVRMGTFSPSGKRVTMHTFENPNSHILPYMNSGTLPLRWEQFNETTVASTSEMKLICTSVLKQVSDPELRGKQFTAMSEWVHITGSSFTPLLTVKPVTIFGGKPNRSTALIMDYEFEISGSAVMLDAIVNATLTGSTFNYPTQSFSSTQIDTSSTSYTGGLQKARIILGPNTTRREVRESLDNTLLLLADGTPPSITFAAKTVNPSGSADMSLLIRWKEIR